MGQIVEDWSPAAAAAAERTASWAHRGSRHRRRPRRRSPAQSRTREAAQGWRTTHLCGGASARAGVAGARAGQRQCGGRRSPSRCATHRRGTGSSSRAATAPARAGAATASSTAGRRGLESVPVRTAAAAPARPSSRRGGCRVQVCMEGVTHRAGAPAGRYRGAAEAGVGSLTGADALLGAR